MFKQSAFSKSLTTLLLVFSMTIAGMGLVNTPNLVHAEETKALYDRLGGMTAITAVVDEFVNRLVADSKVNGRFGSTNVERFKTLNAELVCMATGGPCKYSGRNMKTTPQRHANFRKRDSISSQGI